VELTNPVGEIFHVHSIQYDPYRSGYWVTTGDRDEEASVLFTKDGFQSFEVLGLGSQDWRVVSLIVTEDALYWGSDNDQEPASIFRWDFADERLDEVQVIGSPSYYYSTKLKDGTLVLSTTFEPESPNSLQNSLPATTDLLLTSLSTQRHTFATFLIQPHSLAAAEIPGS
jgi:hypothetical protein